MRSIATLLFLSIMFSPLCVLNAQENAVRDDIIQQFSEACELYRNDNLEEAIYQFNAVLLQRPSDKEALEMREKAGAELLLEMLCKGGELSRIARTLMLYAEETPVRQENSPEVIRNLVRQAATGTMYQRNNAIAYLNAQVGEIAAPYMLEYLANRTQEEERLNIFSAISKMGVTVLNPMLEALESDNSFLRQQIVMILGLIQDERALPDLKKILENRDEEQTIREQASVSIQKISKRPAISLKLAKYLYYEKAVKYYDNDMQYRINSGSARLQWKWNNGNLGYQEILPALYNDIMAEDACYKALQLDPAFDRAWALLLQIYCSQKTKIESVQNAIATQAFEMPQEDAAKFDLAKPRAVHVCNLIKAAGPTYLYYALQDSLRRRNKRPEVTVEILEAVGQVCHNRQTIVRDAVNCLNHADKRVRYAAAQSIASINPTGNFKEAKKVVSVLQEALQEWDSRVVLIVENNDAIRNELSEIIRQENLVVSDTNSGMEGLKSATNFPPEDLIIISNELQDITSTYFVNTVAENFQSANIPILVLGPKDKHEQVYALYSQRGQVKGVIDVPLQKESVQNLIRKVLNEHKNPYKDQSKYATQKSLEVMAQLNPQGAIFGHMEETVDVLNGLLKFKTDENMQLLVIELLGKIGDARSIPSLEEVLANKEESYKIRTKAALALGQIFDKTDQPLVPEEIAQFKNFLGENPVDNPEFLQVMYQLLGYANIDSDDRRTLFLEQRVPVQVIVPPVAEPEEEDEEEEEQKPEAKPEDQKEDEEEDINWGEELLEESESESESEEEEAEESEKEESEDEESEENEKEESEDEEEDEDEDEEEDEDDED